MKYSMGIDIGTTSLKGCVFDENGNEVACSQKAYTLITEGDYVEFPAEEYFRLFEEAYNELASKYKFDCFAIDTQGETIKREIPATGWLTFAGTVEKLENIKVK